MPEKLTFGSLFAGIGGFDLGFERAGMECKWQVEIDDYATKVLEKHWPGVHRERDVRECGPELLATVDVICGGFPCQDISEANLNAQGITGKRSGLWSEFKRLLGVLRPRFAVVENVSAFLGRGLNHVLVDLTEIGFDAEWSVVSACSMGAPHMRERVFIVAYASSERFASSQKVFDRKLQAVLQQEIQGQAWGEVVQQRGNTSGRLRPFSGPAPLGMANGISTRLDRLAGLGNAVVPQIAELIGRRLVELNETNKER